ncbi:hypothetical protein AB5I41_19045 [Sphingomonas sp. MMS24-JH45]
MSKLDRLTGPMVPRVIEVATDEKTEAAIGRFIAQHGRAPASAIVVPARATDNELPDLERMWAEQQRRLVADARTATNKLKEEGNRQHNARIRTIRNAGSGDGLIQGIERPTQLTTSGRATPNRSKTTRQSITQSRPDMRRC